MSILRLYQYLETKRQSKHSTGRCSKHDSGERCHEEAHMHQDPSGMLARIPFGLTTGPIEGAEILVAGCRKETVASEMRSNVLKYRDTLIKCTPFFFFSHRLPQKAVRSCPHIERIARNAQVVKINWGRPDRSRHHAASLNVQQESLIHHPWARGVNDSG